MSMIKVKFPRPDGGRVRWRFFPPIFIIILFFSSSLFSQTPENPLTADTLFARAETFFHEKKTIEARMAYEEFLKAFPQDTRVPKSVFRLGYIDFENKSYVSALRYYNYFLENFPRSTLGYLVRLEMGRCYFALERYQEAEKLFRQAVKENPDVSQKWRAFVYLGQVDDVRLNYDAAFKKYKDVIDKSPFPEIKLEARRYIETLVNERMDKKNLVAFAKSLGNRFPADLILKRLIEIYRIERDAGNYQTSLEDFLFRFPKHELREKFQKALVGFKSSEKGKVKIGVVLPLSGKRALVGQQVLQGIQLAVNQLPAKDKNRLKLVIRDSGLGRTAPEVIEELAQDPNLVGIIGPALTWEIENSLAVLEEYQMPVFTPTASTSGLAERSPYVFRNALTKELQAGFLARYAINELNLYRFVVLYPTTGYGETMRQVFEQEVRSLGGYIVHSIPYARQQNDFRKQILEIGGLADDKLKKVIQAHIKRGTQPKPLDDKGRLSRPLVEGGLYSDDEVETLKVALEFNFDAIFIPGVYDKVSLILPQLAFYNVEDILLMGGNGWNSKRLLENARNYLKSVLYVDGFYANSESQTIIQFVDIFLSTFGQNPTILSAQSYDAMNIFLKVIQEGAFNRVEVAQGLKGIKNYPGVSGVTTILPSGESAKSLVKLTVSDGRIVEASTPSQKTEDPSTQELSP